MPKTETIETTISQTSSFSWYVYGPGGLIATHSANAAIEFALKDHQGSTRVTLVQSHQNGTLSGLSVGGEYAYFPFGGLSTTSGQEIEYGFTGQEYDHESGIQNFRARFLNDEVGRFHAVDPAGQYHTLDGIITFQVKITFK